MSSGPLKKRPPSAQERAGMVALAKQLSQVSTPGLSIAKKASATPPGRLNMRTLIADKQRVPGTGTPAKPFTVRRIVHNPKARLEIAFIGDVSGSMGSLSEPLAITRWMVTEAGLAVHAKVSTILFGSKIYPIQQPGVRMNYIQPWSALDGWETASSAWVFWTDKTQALKHDTTTKIVVWFSDFDLVRENQREAFNAVMEEARIHNITMVAVVPSYYDVDLASQQGIRHIVVLDHDSPIKTANMIGQKIIQAVKQRR